MTATLRDELYSPNPLVRLNASQNATPSALAEFVPPTNEWIVNAFGAANAWLVVVGPSPGTGPGGKVDRPVPPVLGAVLPEFHRFLANDNNGFWTELFRLLRHGFKHAHLPPSDKDAALKLMLAMNLDTTPQGDGKKVTTQMLRDGMARLRYVVDLTAPRMILALKADVYDEIQEWWRAEVGEVGREESHPVPTKTKSGATKCYNGKSRWLTRKGQASILLVKILQHPSRVKTYAGNEARFSDYIGERIRAALDVASR